jgi:hypothetical protein
MTTSLQPGNIVQIRREGGLGAGRQQRSVGDGCGYWLTWHLSRGIPSSARKENLSRVIDVGGIKVSALNDGEVHLPPMYYPGLDFGAHPELLQADWTYHIPVGCFLIQAEDLTVLTSALSGRARCVTVIMPLDSSSCPDFAGRGDRQSMTRHAWQELGGDVFFPGRLGRQGEDNHGQASRSQPAS